MVHHGEALRIGTKDDHLVFHIERDWRQGPIDAMDRAMLTFAEKLNFHPGRIGAEDVDELRKAGFDDCGVLDIVLITSLFNFMNRIVDGVGIRAEDSFRKLKAKGDARVEAGPTEGDTPSGAD